MQLVTPTVLAAMPASASSAADVVAPTRLFAIAVDRLGTAEATLRIGGPGAVPTASVTTLALRELEAGVRTLHSTLVPSTPFHQRQAALGSIDQAQRAISLLETYRTDVEPLGTETLRRGDLQAGTLVMLDDARERIRSAIARIAMIR